MAEKSTHYNLDILKGDDIYNPNTVFDNFVKIDNDMYKIDTNAVHSAVHILSGSVNALTRTNPEYNIKHLQLTSNRYLHIQPMGNPLKLIVMLLVRLSCVLSMAQFLHCLFGQVVQ